VLSPAIKIHVAESFSATILRNFRGLYDLKFKPIQGLPIPKTSKCSAKTNHLKSEAFASGVCSPYLGGTAPAASEPKSTINRPSLFQPSRFSIKDFPNDHPR
jgi:hypothetical protein